jgi:hypothetical protein
VVKSPSGTVARSRRNGRADFLLVAAEIRAALAAGHTLRLVFEQHEERLSFGYIQFTRYVKRYITAADAAALPRPAVGTASALPKPLSFGVIIADRTTPSAARSAATLPLRSYVRRSQGSRLRETNPCFTT